MNPFHICIRKPLTLLLVQSHRNWFPQVRGAVADIRDVEIQPPIDHQQCLHLSPQQPSPRLALLEVAAEPEASQLALIDQLNRQSWTVVAIGHRSLRAYSLVLIQCGAVDVVTSLFELDKVNRVVQAMLAQRAETTVSWKDAMASRLPWAPVR